VLQVAFWGATGSQPSFNEDDASRHRGGRGRGHGSRPSAPTYAAAESNATESGEQWPDLGGSASTNATSLCLPPPVTRQELDSHFPALPGSEDAHTPERSRHLASDRASAAPKEPPWLRDLTRPLSPFSEVAMVKRNKDLAVR
jgi:hypothetical protein